MRVLDVEQGSKSWLQSRVGVVTASRAKDLITVKNGDRSKSSKEGGAYFIELVGERLLGCDLDEVKSGAMDRGKEHEAMSRDWFAFTQDQDVVEVGFCVSDDGVIGCSPDGLIGDDSGLELKNPLAKTQVKYLLDSDQLVNGKEGYGLQCQFSMLVTGRPRWNLLSFCPGIPAVLVEIERDEETIAKLREAAYDLSKSVDEAVAHIELMDPSRDMDEDGRLAANVFA